MNEDEAAKAAKYAQAQEVAREMVTLAMMSNEQGVSDAHVAGVVREKMRDFTPGQSWRLVEVLVRGVAGTFDDLDDWSAHVIASLAEDPS